MIHSLDETFEAGLRWPNYVNGRLLSAEDLGADQQADQRRFAEIGKAIGPGVVHGLMVERNNARKLKITPGMGINPKGEMVRLGGTAFTLSLTLDRKESPENEGARFAACDTGASTRDIVDTGAYLLTAMPISRPEGKVAIQNSTRCAQQWQREGVQFRAIRLEEFENDFEEVYKNLFPESRASTFDLEMVTRNYLAHWCFGTEALKRLPRAPFDFPPNYDPISRLKELTACDLPLAVFYWTDNGLLFVDNWSVRRQLAAPQPAQYMAGLTSDRRRGQGRARWRQFQIQISDIVRNNDLSEDQARLFFLFLPPAGLIPMKPPRSIIKSVCQFFFQSVQSGQSDADNDDLDLAAEALTKLVEQDLQNNGNLFRMDKFFSNNIQSYPVNKESIERTLQKSWYDQAIDLRYDPQIFVLFPRRSVLLLASYIFLTDFDKLVEKIPDVLQSINPELIPEETTEATTNTESAETEYTTADLESLSMVSHRPPFRLRNDFLRSIPSLRLRLYEPIGTKQQRDIVFPVLSQSLQMDRDQVYATLREDTYAGLYCLFLQAEFEEIPR